MKWSVGNFVTVNPDGTKTYTLEKLTLLAFVILLIAGKITWGGIFWLFVVQSEFTLGPEQKSSPRA